MLKLLLNLITLCLAVASCNNVSDNDVLIVDLYIKNHKFSPSTIELPEGRKIVIIVHNQDTMIEEFESIDLNREKIIPGNSEIKITLAPLKAGEYKFFGDFHPETAQGKIIVK